MLTDTAIRKAKPAENRKRLSDGKGLYIEVAPSGGKWWRLKYRFSGKEKRISLGTYPEVSLKQARDRRDNARAQVADGIDPSVQRRADKAAMHRASVETFAAIAEEWQTKQKPRWTVGYAQIVARRLEKNIYPWLGNMPLTHISPQELLSVLRRTESRGAVDTARRLRMYCSQIFRYAVATGRAERDPAADLRGALQAAPERHYASIQDPELIGGLLRAIDSYRGDVVTRSALALAPLVFVRPGELRGARWAEIDFDEAQWRIPSERMKKRAPHIVPLSQQAVAVLRELHLLTGSGDFVFPGVRSRKRCMSENTVTAALRRMGYASGEMTGHGFRSLASTRLNEMGWNRDAIERQLAHAERDKVRAAYNYAEHLPERRCMMQTWADYLDSLRGGSGKVVAIGAA